MEYKDTKLIIEKWIEPDIEIFGTIRTNPENYYVATILNSGYLKFKGIEAMTRDFPQDKITKWFNNTLRIPQRGC